MDLLLDPPRGLGMGCSELGLQGPGYEIEQLAAFSSGLNDP